MMTTILVLVGHFVADFLAQSDWMALNKSKNNEALLVHTLIYTACMTGFMSLVLHNSDALVVFALVTFVAHTLTDWCTSRVTSALWFIDLQKVPEYHPHAKHIPVGTIEIETDYGNWVSFDYVANVTPGDRHWFFVAIGFDQLLHYVQLFWTVAIVVQW